MPGLFCSFLQSTCLQSTKDLHTGSWLTIISPLFFKLLNSKLLFRSPDRNLNTSLTNWVVVMFLEWWARLWSRDKWCKWCPRYYLFLSVNMLGADPASHLSTGVHQVGIFFPYDRTQVRYLSITRLVMFVRLDWMRKSWRFFMLVLVFLLMLVPMLTLMLMINLHLLYCLCTTPSNGCQLVTFDLIDWQLKND